MVEDNKRRSKHAVKALSNVDVFKLQEDLNKFYEEHFILTTQVFPPHEERKDWIAIIYYNIRL